MADSRLLLMVLTGALGVALPGLLSCPSEEPWACEGEDHRPPLPADGNACHEAFELLIRANECQAGFYDKPELKGLEGRNGKLAYYFALADFANAAELAACEEDIAENQALIDAEDCAAPSTDCGPAPVAQNACHTFYQTMADWRLACDPQTYTADGFGSYDAFVASKLAAADYATAEEQQSPCTSQLSIYQGPCF